MIFALKKLPHLSLEEFQKYWKEKHGLLAQKNLPKLRAKKYVQNHTIDTPYNEVLQGTRNAMEPYDGIVEIWWDSIEDLETASLTPEGMEASEELLNDEKQFIDLSRSSLWFCEEHVLLDK
jgi:uncharacterized protein (TIGR02118 family)